MGPVLGWIHLDHLIRLSFPQKPAPAKSITGPRVHDLLACWSMLEHFLFHISWLFILFWIHVWFSMYVMYVCSIFSMDFSLQFSMPIPSQWPDVAGFPRFQCWPRPQSAALTASPDLSAMAPCRWAEVANPDVVRPDGNASPMPGRCPWKPTIRQW